MKTQDVETFAILAAVGFGLYLMNKAANFVANAGDTLYTGAQNLDTNVGLGPFDAWVSSLFNSTAQ